MISVSFTFLFAICFVGTNARAIPNAQYMRRQDPATLSEKSDPSSVAMPDERVFVADIASNGEINKLSDKHGQEAASMAAYRQSYFAVKAMLDEAHKADVFDKDGFEVSQVSLGDRLRQAEDSKVRKTASLREMQRAESEDMEDRQELSDQGGMGAQLLQTKEEDYAKKMKEQTYSGTNPVVSGFWAADRPNEERIDPDNMKIYTFKTYKRRFPFVHSWEVETMWKKLPEAPKQVHKATKLSGNEVGSLLDEGMTLVDEQQRELVWTKDYNGYYHMGADAPTDEQILAVQRPIQIKAENLLEAKAGLYSDYSSQLVDMQKRLKSENLQEREGATQRLEQMLVEMERVLKQKPARAGKAYVSVRGSDGLLCSFNADIAKVTGRAMKQRIEKMTGIAHDSQRLFYKGTELQDFERLREHTGAGRGVWIDLQHKDSIQPLSGPLPEIAAPSQTQNVGATPMEVQQGDSIRMLTAVDTSGNAKSEEKAAVESEDSEEEVEHGMSDNEDEVSTAVQADERFAQAREKAAQEQYNEDARMMAAEMRQAELLKNRLEREKELDVAEAAKAAKPSQMNPVQREAVYVKEDGVWRVEKEELATPDHAIAKTDNFDQGVDEGIPVQERLSEIKVEHKAGIAASALKGPTASLGGRQYLQDSPATAPTLRDIDPMEDPSLLQADHPKKRAFVATPNGHAFNKKQFIKEMKHAMSEEMQAEMREEEREEEERALQAQAASAKKGVAVPSQGNPALPDSFIQTGSSSSGDDDEDDGGKTVFVMERTHDKNQKSKAELAAKIKAWREAANPTDDSDAADPMSLGELSKKRTEKEKAYDGMQPVLSGSWAADRPKERRVDMTDRKVYTYKQYRLKFPFKHTWEVEDMWKLLPTEKRVKQLGSKAFIQRFR